MNESYIPYCSIPFQNMVIDATGDVTPCPYIISNPDIPNVMGNVNDSSILEIWNGENYKKLRTYLYSKEGEEGCAGCLYMQQFGSKEPAIPAIDGIVDYEKSEAWKNYLLFLDDVKHKRIILEAKPAVISFTESHACNFRCIMCYQSYNRAVRLKNLEKTRNELFELLPYMSQLTAGGGSRF